MLGKTVKLVAGALLALTALNLSEAAPLKNPLTVYQPNTGAWYVKNLDAAPTVFGLPFGGFSTAVPFTGDLTDDGVFELGIYDSKTARWFVLNGTNGSLLVWNVAFGPSNAIPMAVDMNGDGPADLVSFDPKNGNWNARTLGGTVLLNNTNWGFTGCIPVPGDYDGDGTNDLAVFDTQASKWYIRTIPGAILLSGYTHGFTGCKVVPGDFDGDGADDLAVYQPSTGNWFIRRLNGSVIVWGGNWGFNGAVPVPGDYNGDGTSDLAVYHTAAGRWYIYGLALGQQWGTSAMTPVPKEPVSTPAYLPIKGADGAGGGFLWKPFADNGGTVVLLPSFYSVSRLVVSRDPAGTDLIASFASGGMYKGRWAFRNPLTGNNFGNNIYCVAILTNGQRQPWYIPAGGSRVD